MNDNELILLYRLNKEDKYFNIIYNRYTNIKENYCKKHRDVFQYESDFNIVFLNAVNTYNTNSKETFLSYLIKCLKHKCEDSNDVFKFYHRYKERLSITNYDLMHNKLIRSIYNNLDIYCKNDRDKCIILYVLFEDMRVEDVAEIFNLSSSRIYSIVSGYKKYIRSCYSKMEETDGKK